MTTRKLSELSIGEKGRVLSIDCDIEIKRRMADMGLVPGVEVELRRIAPLGDPIEIILRGYRLALRKHEAYKIIVEM